MGVCKKKKTRQTVPVWRTTRRHFRNYFSVTVNKFFNFKGEFRNFKYVFMSVIYPGIGFCELFFQCRLYTKETVLRYSLFVIYILNNCVGHIFPHYSILCVCVCVKHFEVVGKIRYSVDKMSVQWRPSTRFL